MGRGKRGKTDAQRSSQRRRTHKNKIKKYEKLLKEFPDSKDKGIWQQKLEHSQRKI